MRRGINDGAVSLNDGPPKITHRDTVARFTSDDVQRQIMNDNPRRFLAFVPNVKRKA